MGVDVDGAFAEYVIRPVEAVGASAAPMPGRILAVLTDAVATPLHGLKRVAHLEAGETLVVVGIGGLGSSAVQLGEAMGARVIAVTRSAARRELARDLGADDVVAAGDEGSWPRCATWRAATAPTWWSSAPADPRADEAAIAVGGPGGRVVLIGAALEPFSVRATEIFWRELAVLGSAASSPTTSATPSSCTSRADSTLTTWSSPRDRCRRRTRHSTTWPAGAAPIGPDAVSPPTAP